MPDLDSKKVSLHSKEAVSSSILSLFCRFPACPGQGMFNVFVAKDKGHKFMYYDPKKARSRKDFNPQMHSVDMSFPGFVHRLRSSKPDDNR